MSNSFFKFKRFTVFHNKCAMKVGTDGVLIGSWVPLKNVKNVLDIGTGTGLIALMIAQRSATAKITALDIDDGAVLQAEENVALSEWSDRIEVVKSDFNLFNPEEKYDCIVSNPPYFENSLKCEKNLARTKARHTDSLPFSQLFEGVCRMLSDNGTFTLIVPFDAAERIKNLASEHRLFLIRQLSIITKPQGNPRRAILSFSFLNQETECEELLTEVARHQYSDEYVKLTKDFYLKF